MSANQKRTRFVQNIRRCHRISFLLDYITDCGINIAAIFEHRRKAFENCLYSSV